LNDRTKKLSIKGKTFKRELKFDCMVGMPGLRALRRAPALSLQMPNSIGIFLTLDSRPIVPSKIEN
jgi:hypothetical protein